MVPPPSFHVSYYPQIRDTFYGATLAEGISYHHLDETTTLVLQLLGKPQLHIVWKITEKLSRIN